MFINFVCPPYFLVLKMLVPHFAYVKMKQLDIVVSPPAFVWNLYDLDPNSKVSQDMNFF